jgi:hypothetical protein
MQSVVKQDGFAASPSERQFQFRHTPHPCQSHRPFDRHHPWLRKKRKQETLEKEAQEKETEAMQMEEAKVSNADESVLRACDAWGRGGQKEVGAHKEADLKVEDAARSLASGKTNVGFKKKKKPAGSRNRWMTSADGDD